MRFSENTVKVMGFINEGDIAAKISSNLKISIQGTDKIIKELEHKGMIIRSPGKRERPIKITEKGMVFKGICREAWDMWQEK